MREFAGESYRSTLAGCGDELPRGCDACRIGGDSLTKIRSPLLKKVLGEQKVANRNVSDLGWEIAHEAVSHSQRPPIPLYSHV